MAFPSFHVIWAVLITVATRRQLVFYPTAFLNALVVASTVNTDMHYFTDVLGGLAVAWLVVELTRLIVKP